VHEVCRFGRDRAARGRSARSRLDRLEVGETRTRSLRPAISFHRCDSDALRLSRGHGLLCHLTQSQARYSACAAGATVRHRSPTTAAGSVHSRGMCGKLPHMFRLLCLIAVASCGAATADPRAGATAPPGVKTIIVVRHAEACSGSRARAASAPRQPTDSTSDHDDAHDRQMSQSRRAMHPTERCRGMPSQVDSKWYPEARDLVHLHQLARPSAARLRDRRHSDREHDDCPAYGRGARMPARLTRWPTLLTRNPPAGWSVRMPRSPVQDRTSADMCTGRDCPRVRSTRRRCPVLGWRSDRPLAGGRCTCQ
jgi:hypothetical protein